MMRAHRPTWWPLVRATWRDEAGLIRWHQAISHSFTPLVAIFQADNLFWAIVDAVCQFWRSERGENRLGYLCRSPGRGTARLASEMRSVHPSLGSSRCDPRSSQSGDASPEDR